MSWIFLDFILAADFLWWKGMRILEMKSLDQ